MLNLTVNSYNEHNDTFRCSTIDSVLDTIYDIDVPASLMPYLAPDLCAFCEDLPFDLINRGFVLRSPIID